MTDIARLLTSIKRRAAHVKEFGDDITFVKLEDLDALVEALEKAQTQSSKWLEAYHKAVSIGARYEERIAELEFIRTSADKVQREFAEELGCAGDNESILQAIEDLKVQSETALELKQAALADNAHLKLELEILGSRTVTVKLPDLRQIVSGDRYVWSDGVYNYSQDVKVALASAGIKWEAE